MFIFLLFFLFANSAAIENLALNANEAAHTHRADSQSESNAPLSRVPELAAQLPSATTTVSVHVENADDFRPKRGIWELAIALIALATFMFRAFFDWRGVHRTFYIHLSNVWYELKRAERVMPAWADPEFTTLYHVERDSTLHASVSSYDIHAWMCWALAEDCFEAYFRRHPITGWFVQRILRVEGEQFRGPVRNINELHWAWLAVPENKCRFGQRFRSWLSTEFPDRIEPMTVNAVNGNGAKATEQLFAGRHIGSFDGKVVPDPETLTIQVGKHTHILVPETNPAHLLNHSMRPNAVIRGMNIVALEDIAKDQEITINYNATEWTMKTAFQSRPDDHSIEGFKSLDEARRKSLQPLLHRWIRESIAKPPASAPAESDRKRD